MKALDAIGTKLDGWLNPVLVKELRQAVRGRFIVTMLSLSLLAQIIAVSIFMLTDSLEARGMTVTAVGADTFTTLFFVMFTATVFFIPLYGGLRMAVERSDSNVDLLFVTTIRPRTIVIGKLLTLMALTALIFSASLPFLVFSYVLRGIDVLTIFFVLAIGFIAVTTASIVALFLGCIPASKPFRFVLGIGFCGLTLMSYAGLASVITSVIRTSTGSMFASPDFWSGVIATTVLVVGLDAVLLVVTTTIITPPAANRALPIRAMASIVWLLSLGAATRLVFKSSDGDPLEMWATAMIALITIVLCSAIGERETWGPRVARTIPRNVFKRAFAFLFYSGGGGGTLWTIVFFALTTAAYAIVMKLRPPVTLSVGKSVSAVVFVEAALCFLSYALTGLFLRRRWLHRVPPRATWAIGLMIFLAVAIVPPLVLLAGYSGTAALKQHYDIITILNPFPRLEGAAHALRLPVLIAWAIAAFVVNVPWIAEQWRAFRRMPIDEASDDVTIAAESEVA